MKRTLFGVALLFTAHLFAGVVENFALLDHDGKAHNLYYYSDADAVVIMIHGNGCPIVRNALPDFRDLRSKFVDRDVKFLLLNSNVQDDRNSIAKEADEWMIDFPILDDVAQVVGIGLDLTRTAEVLVIDPSNWELKYRGPINDRFEYERQRENAEEHYVSDAISAIINDEEYATRQVAAKGCLVNFPDTQEDGSEISYADDIVPMLEKNCTACHVEGGIGSWAMSSYEMVKGFAPMMREVLRTGRMPPWHADPHVGTWANDRGIAPAEKQLIVRWIDASAPRGDGPDPLKANPKVKDEWPLGPPDYIVEFSAFDVQASGVVDYQYFVVDNHMEEDRWLKAMTVVPGDSRVLHHVLMGTVDGNGGGRSLWNQFLGGYAPGSNLSGVEGPKDAGVLVRKDSKFRAQMHYTPIGIEVTDTTRVGLYFFDEPPQTIKRFGVALNPLLQIPPGEKAHSIRSYMSFHRDATLHSLLPHSHYRGRASTFTLEYPDGRMELLLSVPSYDFNWQTSYQLVEPKSLPAGSKLHHETFYDNSKQNPANPDPNRRVTWGQQSWDEMQYGSFVYTWDGESVENLVHDGERMSIAQSVGYMDKDANGLVERNELIGRLGRGLLAVFDTADADNNGGLDIDEMLTMRRMAQQARGSRTAESDSD